MIYYRIESAYLAAIDKAGVLMIYYRIERSLLKNWEGEKMRKEMIYYRIESQSGST